MGVFSPLSPETLRWAAEQTLRMHRVEGYTQMRCQQCYGSNPLNCPQLRWARSWLAINGR